MIWVGIWNTEAAMRGWEFDGATLVKPLDAGACRAAFETLPADRILVAGAEGAPPDKLPSSVLPDKLLTGPDALILPGFEQSAPLHRISGGRLTALGFLALNDGWDGVICLPGPVTHWLSISAGEAVFLQSSLTLGIAATLQAANAHPDDTALSGALSRPERLATGLRSAALAGDHGAIMGQLLGAELAATRALWLGQQLAVLGDGPGHDAYCSALVTQGAPVTRASAAVMAEKGMKTIGARFRLGQPNGR